MLREFQPPRPYAGPPVIVLGDLLVDYVVQIQALPPAGGDAVIHSWEVHPGGAGLNTSVGLSLLGVSSALVGVVGEDNEGERLRRHLAERGVDTSFLQRQGRTGYVLSLVDAHAERTMFSYRGSSATPVELTTGLELALNRTPLLFVSGYGLQHRDQAEVYLAAARRVKEGGGLVAFDPTPVISQVDRRVVERVLALADILLSNEAELQTLTGCDRLEDAIGLTLRRVHRLGLKLGQRGAKVAVVKAGEALVMECPTREVAAVDTTGAGDAFNVGFLAALLYGLPPRTWGEWGNNLAARVVMKKGASL